mmetsp:Transcript_22994/g.46234  ORF Transcript_22994/g.46234 Transcript_22994/m.46234 type:complete len:171 (-) Transcript_22994:37-549(-)
MGPPQTKEDIAFVFETARNIDPEVWHRRRRVFPAAKHDAVFRWEEHRKVLFEGGPLEAVLHGLDQLRTQLRLLLFGADDDAVPNEPSFSSEQWRGQRGTEQHIRPDIPGFAQQGGHEVVPRQAPLPEVGYLAEVRLQERQAALMESFEEGLGRHSIAVIAAQGDPSIHPT